jgi:hypothetical protein
MKKKIFLHPESHRRKELDQDPDPVVRGMDSGIRIRIRTKMSRIPKTAQYLQQETGLGISAAGT